LEFFNGLLAQVHLEQNASVIPAQAGIQRPIARQWIAAFGRGAGRTNAAPFQGEPLEQRSTCDSERARSSLAASHRSSWRFRNTISAVDSPNPKPEIQNPQSDHSQTMQCMEVWGGNRAVDSGVVMAGLDAWVFSQPCGSDAGGDVHYVSSCATGRITRLLLADVSGHGAVVADTAGKLRQLMRRYVNHIDQKKFVASLNGEFAALSQDGRFATAIATTFFAPTRHISLCNAGHPPPLLYRASKREWSLLHAAPTSVSEKSPQNDAANIPLGVFDVSTYDQHSIRLSVGDLVLCYTDGLTESRDADGRLLGTRGLLEIVRKLDVSRPEIFISSLMKAIAALNETNLRGDDVTALLFRPNGLAKRAPLSERLRGAGRWFAVAGKRLIGGKEPIPWPESKIANLGGAIFAPLNRMWRG
jgi:sigma-B regulation protein RsbU (phosphoserine phosphatase)